MEGKSLIPLNQMDKDKELFQGYSKKYIGREELIQQSFPLLNCLWNDVVQFSALDPRIIIKELRKYNEDLVLSRKSFYKFSVKDITSHYEAIVFDRDLTRKDKSFKVEAHEVRKLEVDSYKELEEVPKRTIEYWKKVKAEGGVFLMFPFITHVMVKGLVDTSLAEEIPF
jgi:hypothetical protein